MKLIVLGLPLGNAEDISIRAIKTLETARLVICEDTRVFYKLWQKLKFLGYLENNFDGKLLVINDFNEKGKVGDVLNNIILENEAVLVSDAGMPTISDPGYRLVRAVVEAGGEVTSVPGPTAITTALAISGLSADRVIFLGFLPIKQIKRQNIWEGIKKLGFGVTLAIYESPVRVNKTLDEIRSSFGETIEETVVVRELTKEHEEIIRGEIEEIKDRKFKGEVVILVRIK